MRILVWQTLKVYVEQVVFVEPSAVIVAHLPADAIVAGAHVRLEPVQGVGEGVDAVDHELHFGVLLVVDEVAQPT